MKFLASMLSEGDGSPSSMRCLVFLVVLITMIPGAISAVRTGGNFVPTPEQISLITLALGAKLVQKTQECTRAP
jgi:hypothetical protein